MYGRFAASSTASPRRSLLRVTEQNAARPRRQTASEQFGDLVLVVLEVVEQ